LAAALRGGQLPGESADDRGVLNGLARYAAVIDHVVDTDRAAPPDGELSALRARRTVLVA
jgi:hypothetical protein